MQNLTILHTHLITYKDDLLTIDVLGSVDKLVMERMLLTLRIAHAQFPFYRTTLDLYSEQQTDQLLRTLCDKWELKLPDVTKTIHALTFQLEEYRMAQWRMSATPTMMMTEATEEEQKKALALLKSKTILPSLENCFNAMGILGEDQNTLILFFALASHKYLHPFSVLCLLKSAIGKTDLLQKLSDCMPIGTYSFHSQLSPSALYYMDSDRIHHKALIIEDMEWTNQMLAPLATLQTNRRLIKTSATKDKEGRMHSTTFELMANLCLIGCAQSDKNLDQSSLPFLCVPLNNSCSKDMALMQYQKQVKAGLVNEQTIKDTQRLLQCVISSLQTIKVINPYAPFIHLPADVAHPRKSLSILLNFIEVITYFFQYQREQIPDKSTGEVLIKTHPADIELAFELLKNNLLQKADELSTPARNFYNWLTNFLTQSNLAQFTQLDIRKEKNIHPRTIARYLQELVLFSYVQVCGGNKHRGGHVYKLTNFNKQTNGTNSIEADLQNTMQQIWEAYHDEKNGNRDSSTNIHADVKIEQPPEPITENSPADDLPIPTEQQTLFPTPAIKRIRIDEKEEHTFKLLLSLEAQQSGREYVTEDFTALSGRSYPTEARYLKALWQQGKLNREWKNRQYYYTLMRGSETVRQNPLSHSQHIES